MKLLVIRIKSLGVAALVFAVSRAHQAFANPTGLSGGSATLQQLGSQLNITVGQTAVLNWQSFNIGTGETTSFLQPSANSVVFNVIGSQSPSQIFGNLNANGTVILANANGFYFGPDSLIKVGGSFIATTAPLAPDFGAGGMWLFTGMPPLANIVNYGRIEVGTGRSLYLLAEKIENHGQLSAPGGDVELAAGSEVLVSDSADGRSLSATVRLPQGTVDNFGTITADAGTIALNARVVNQDGVLQADSIANHNGVIELVAADQLHLGGHSQILARGDASTSGSAGGTIILKSDSVFTDTPGSGISVAGGSSGGNGGSVEISTAKISAVNSRVDGSAQAGFRGGSLLLDPDYIVLNQSGTGALNANGTDGTALAGANPGTTLGLNVNSAFIGLSQITLQAKYDITLADNTTWDLSGSTGQNAGQVSLEAGRNVIFGKGASILDANNWSLAIYAGVADFSHPTIVAPGAGSIYLGGFNGSSALGNNGTIQLAAGSVSLVAGQSVLVGSGSVFTTGGGSIFANALTGDINAGTSNGSADGLLQSTDFDFSDSGWIPNSILGGFSTAAGGNVTLLAGNNVISSPTVPSRQAPGASGAYGAGDVTVVAGNQITGNYVVTDGAGRLFAGVSASAAQSAAMQNPAADPSAYATALNDLVTSVKQSHNAGGNLGASPVNGNPSTAPVSLGLTRGSWNVWAANDISLKQVFNPNGAFNDSQAFAFDYAPNASVSLWAGNAIELIGGSYGSAPSSVRLTPIYAPVLSLNAGAGGIKLDQGILLAPGLYKDPKDPQTGKTYGEGSLSIVTRDGGNLTGATAAGSTVLNGITMSDSASADYRTFASEHDNLYLEDPRPSSDPLFKPVQLDISGSIGTFSLTVPTFADILVRSTKPYVTADGLSYFGTYNFGFKGRNMSSSQTTSIDVLGTIAYRGNLTTIDLTPEQAADPLPATLFTDSAAPAITAKVRYDATTGRLIYVGVMSADELAFLKNPSVIVPGQFVTQLDSNGDPLLDANGNPQLAPATAPLTLDATQMAMLQQLYSASQGATLGDQGLALAGPGTFSVSANAMDLGVSGGIRVLAPNLKSAADVELASISHAGTSLEVTTLGDLTMTSTKISNESYLGYVSVNVGGTLDVGGQFTTLGDPSAPKGIFTTSGGKVTVRAHGDVNVNGSRIAAYDGGDITVTSETGDVNAGTGGAGYVTFQALQLDPVSGNLTGVPATIPGSGILATTVVGSDAALGNVTLEAPQGSINASRGGVLQIAFNGADTKQNFIQIDAGKDINATGSGIIGSNIKLIAGGNINGVVVGSDSVNINALHNVDVTAVSGGGVSIAAAGSVSGTIVGGGDVSVSGDSIDAAVRGGSVSTAGNTSGAAIGVPPSNVAKENTEVAANVSTTTAKASSDDEDEFKSKKKGIALSRKASRVTVLLPANLKLKTQN